MITPSRRTILQGLTAIAATPARANIIAPASAGPPLDPTKGRTLAFEDNFNTFDATVWNAGPKATTFDTGHYGRAAFARAGGEEGVDPYSIVDDAACSDGRAMQIQARYVGKPMRVHGYYGNDLAEYQWIGGNIQTARKDGAILNGWRNGYFEARMWAPRHPLSWPAFWLMNGRSILHPKTSIEIDVIEHKGWELNQYGVYLHEWGNPGEHHEGVSATSNSDLTEGYHSYGVLIDGAQCCPYFDRRPVLDPGTGQPVNWTIGRAKELDDQHDVFWPLLSLTMRQDVPYPAALRMEDLTANLRIDYFRVYA